jgi:hypothetical protein
MERDICMQRLLQGDVGTGKTVVAFLSLLHWIRGTGGQVAYMAPTTILATQVAKKLAEFLEPYGITSALLLGSFLKSFQTGDDDRETGDARFEDRNTEPFHGPWDGDIGCDGDIGRVEEELDVFSGKIREEDDSILESKLSDGLFAAREETHVTRDTFFGDSTGSDEEH